MSRIKNNFLLMQLSKIFKFPNGRLKSPYPYPEMELVRQPITWLALASYEILVRNASYRLYIVIFSSTFSLF